ncbi:MAG: flagellar basal body-associated FliL family protein [Rubrivivax sp.]|nr:flagellar basal body-associated FliL family protein [Rubrivivax sp.]
MSSAAAAPDAGAAPAAKGGKKKLLIIIGAVVALLLVAGGGAVFYLKSKAAAAAAAEEAEDEGHADKKAKPAAVAKDPKQAPTFVPLDPFTVNLADRDAERYAQVGMTLELADPKMADTIKVYMPVIRNNILMVLAHKTSAEMLGREGKDKLARDIQRETARALGIEVEDEEEEAAKAEDEEKPKKKKKKKRAPVELPVTAVHFSNFIIQ